MTKEKIPTAYEFLKQTEVIVDFACLHKATVMLNDFAKLHLEAQAEEIKEKVEVGHYACGDPITCGCMGTCEAPYYSVKKESIYAASKNYIEQNLK